MDDFKLHIIEKIVDEIGSEGIDESIIEVPPDPLLGDYAFPCFVLSKRLKKAPAQIAEYLTGKIKPDEMIAEVKSFGPYLNFFVNKALMAGNVLEESKKAGNKYGHSGKGDGKTIVIEYPGPNTNKPLHLGHMRNMALGLSMSNILKSQGYEVKIVNINNDRGIHICKSMLAYKKWGMGKTPESEERKSDHFVGDYYVMFSKKADEALEQESKEMLLKWEKGDKEIRELWQKMNTWAFSGFKQTYKRFGLSEFDKEYYESETYEGGKKMVMGGLKKGLFKKNDDGAVIVDLEKEGLGEKVLLRSDGTSVYVTQDLYTAQLRHEEFNFDKMIYVVATEQNYHFKVLFTILEKLGHRWSEGCHHFAYGMVHLPEGRMKSREGTVVDADDLIEELENLAAEEIKKRHITLSEEETANRKRMISLGAIKFFLLKGDAIKDMTFNPEESISFEGDTGPYVQYTHARACSILRKAEQEIDVHFDADASSLKKKSETALIHELSLLPTKTADACEMYRPHIIAQSLLSISRSFNEFYHACPCIQEKDEKLRNARLLLIDCTRQALANGLAMLGIDALEKM